MSNPIKDIIRAQLSTLEPQLLALWDQYQQADKAMEPYKKDMEEKRSKWCDANVKIRWLKEQLNSEP